MKLLISGSVLIIGVLLAVFILSGGCENTNKSSKSNNSYNDNAFRIK